MATKANGATEVSAKADSDHQGVTDELRETMETGNSCVSVKVRVKAKKSHFTQKSNRTYLQPLNLALN